MSPVFLTGGRDMGALMRSHDWAASPLGVPALWPEALRTLVTVMLSSNQPMFIAWGTEATLIYNDKYAEILASKHPWALGRPFLEVWNEIHEDLVPIVEQAYAGVPVHMDDIELHMVRRGYPEEAHFSFSYTPVRDHTGQVAGFFCPCVEITAQVLADRRRDRDTERQRLMFEQAPGFIAILRGSEHVFEFANHSYVRLFGSRNLIGKTAREAFPDLAGQKFFDLLDHAYKTGESFVGSQVPVKLRASSDVEAQSLLLDFIYQPIVDDAGQITGIFVEGHDVTERVRAEAAVRQSEERYKLIVEGAEDFAIITLNESGGITGWNTGAERMLGFSEAEALGQPGDIFFTPEDRASGAADHEMNHAQSDGRAISERWHQRKDGSRFWGSGLMMRLDGAGGGYLKIFRDRTGEHEAESETRQSETQLRNVVLASPFPIMLHAEDGEVLELSRKWTELTGYTRDQIRTHFDWGRLAYGEGFARFTAEVAREFNAEGEVAAGEWPVRTKDGSIRTWDFYNVGLGRLPDGRRLQISAAVDVTERKRAEEHQRMLIDELNHRVKNTLATVQSIAAQTLRGSIDLASFRENFEGRLLVLARAHDVLTKTNWEGADLATIVSQALAPFTVPERERFQSEGPDVRLSARQALVFAMALHELATNAVKYGGLSVPTGHVTLSWTKAGPDTLEFSWVERGGPRVEPPTRRGFGTRLLEAGLAQDMGGRVSVVFEPSGLRCEITAPLGEGVT